MLNQNEIRKFRLLVLERTILINKLIERDISEKISKARLEGLEKLGKQQPNVILIIGTMGEMIPSYIGLCLNIDRSSLSRMLDSLEKKGIVSRRTDPKDRRKILISLTEKGKRYYEIIQEKMDEVQAHVMYSFSQEDLKKYETCVKTEIGILKKVDSNLSEEDEL